MEKWLKLRHTVAGARGLARKTDGATTGGCCHHRWAACGVQRLASSGSLRQKPREKDRERGGE